MHIDVIAINRGTTNKNSSLRPRWTNTPIHLATDALTRIFSTFINSRVIPTCGSNVVIGTKCTWKSYVEKQCSSDGHGTSKKGDSATYRMRFPANIFLLRIIHEYGQRRAKNVRRGSKYTVPFRFAYLRQSYNSVQMILLFPITSGPRSQILCYIQEAHVYTFNLMFLIYHFHYE